MIEGEDVRKVRMSVELMEQIVEAAVGRGTVIEWGEPDEEGFYVPIVRQVGLGRDAIRQRLGVELDDQGRVV